MAAVLAALAAMPALATARTAPDGFMGVVMSGNTPANAEIDRIARGGATTLRFNINWSSVEPKPPNGISAVSRFSRVDQVVGRASMNGVRLLPVVIGTPKWLSDKTLAPPIATDRQRAEWRRFLQDLVERYGPGGDFWAGFKLLNPTAPVLPIRQWQIWNEPTTSATWQTGAKRRKVPKQYARLLVPSADAIHEVDPAAGIVTAGVFGTPHSGHGLKSKRFFERLFRYNGVKSSFTGVGVHPYSPDLRGMRIQIQWAVRELARAGLRKKRIWITEIGWPTRGRKNDIQAYLKRSPAGQAAELSRAFEALIRKRQRLRVERAFWYAHRDNPDAGSKRCNLCLWSGLFTRKMAPKPSWYAYTRLAGGTP